MVRNRQILDWRWWHYFCNMVYAEKLLLIPFFYLICFFTVTDFSIRGHPAEYSEAFPDPLFRYSSQRARIISTWGARTRKTRWPWSMRERLRNSSSRNGLDKPTSVWRKLMAPMFKISSIDTDYQLVNYTIIENVYFCISFKSLL